MTSAIDPTVPVDGVDVAKSALRANFLAAKNEIEALQGAPPGSGGLTLTNDANASITLGAAVNGKNLRLTHATPVLVLDAQAPVGTIVGANPAGGTSAAVTVESGATYFTTGGSQVGAGATAGFNIRGPTLFECQANSGGSAAKWMISGDTDLDEIADGDLEVVANFLVGGDATVNGQLVLGAAASANFMDKILQRPELRDYAETVQTQTGVTGGITIDYAAAPHHRITHGAGNITGVTVSNWPANNKGASLTVDYKQDATGGRTVVHPAGTVWVGGTPTFNTAANKTNRVLYTSSDGGTTVVAHYGGDW